MGPHRPVGSTTGSPVLDYQSRNIVHNVFNYLKDHRDFRHECLQDIEIRTARATKVSVSQVKRVRRQGKESVNGVIEPRKRRKRLAPILSTIDDEWKESLRREVLSFLDRGELPTIAGLHRRVTEPPLSFKGCQATLRKIVKELGFRWESNSNNLEENLSGIGKKTWILRLRKSSAEKECISEHESNLSEDDKGDYFEDTESSYTSSEDEASTLPPESGVQSTTFQPVKKNIFIDVGKSLREQTVSLNKVCNDAIENVTKLTALEVTIPNKVRNLTEMQKHNNVVQKSFCSHMQLKNKLLNQNIRKQRLEICHLFEDLKNDLEQHHTESQALEQEMESIQQQLVNIHKAQKEQEKQGNRQQEILDLLKKHVKQ